LRGVPRRDGSRHRAVQLPARRPQRLQRLSMHAGEGRGLRRAMTRGGDFEKPTTLAIEIARHLREQILSGALPAGERVNETRITRELALSRSPVREALRILESEGLVTLEPHRGARVRGMSEQD